MPNRVNAGTQKSFSKESITTGTVTLLAHLKLDKAISERTIGLAPMAGISDWPFRTICTALGADFTVTEMISADPKFRDTSRNALRLDLKEDSKVNNVTSGSSRTPKIVQIAGADPKLLIDAAKMAVDFGAEIVDINMGCPAKKVCKQLAGSALMKDEALVGQLLSAVVAAVDVPITVKMRTGWDRQHKNAISIATMAESIGVQGLTIHGRTRACRFNGTAEYDTIKAVKQSVNIPVVANGDICTPQMALHVLSHTECDGLMIGRAAVGNPWIFAQIKSFLTTGITCETPKPDVVLKVAKEHLEKMHSHYGDLAIKTSRKHIVGYANLLPNGEALRTGFNQKESRQAQLNFLSQFNNYNNNPGVLAA